MNFTFHNDQNIYVTIKKHIQGSQTPVYSDGSQMDQKKWKQELKSREADYVKLKPYIGSNMKCKVLYIDCANRQHRGFDSLQTTRIGCKLNDGSLQFFYVGTEDDGGWHDRYEVEFSVE